MDICYQIIWLFNRFYPMPWIGLQDRIIGITYKVLRLMCFWDENVFFLKKRHDFHFIVLSIKIG